MIRLRKLSSTRRLDNAESKRQTTYRPKWLETNRRQRFALGNVQTEELAADRRSLRAGIDAKKVTETLQRKGKLWVPKYIQFRVRYFCAGAMVGGREFEEEMFHAHRQRFGPNRRFVARRIKDVEAELFTVRDLQVDFPSASKKQTPINNFGTVTCIRFSTWRGHRRDRTPRRW